MHRLDKENTGTVLSGANHAHREPIVSVGVVVRVEVRIVEVHVVRVVAIVVRSRPVVAVGTDIVDRSPVPVARSRQEDSCTRRRPSFTQCQKNLSEPMALFSLSFYGAAAYELFPVSILAITIVLQCLALSQQ